MEEEEEMKMQKNSSTRIEAESVSGAAYHHIVCWLSNVGGGGVLVNV